MECKSAAVLEDIFDTLFGVGSRDNKISLEASTGRDWKTATLNPESIRKNSLKNNEIIISYSNGTFLQLKLFDQNISVLSLSPSSFNPSDYYRIPLTLRLPINNGISLWKRDLNRAWTIPKRFSVKFDNGIASLVFFESESQIFTLFPLDASGFRSSIVPLDLSLGIESTSGTKGRANQNEPIPLLAFGVAQKGSLDMYSLLRETIRVGFISSGRPLKTPTTSILSTVWKHLGWCSWNSSNLGNILSSTFLLESVRTLRRKGAPLKWALIDDGWMQSTDSSQLQSFEPARDKFLKGFKGVVDDLKGLGLLNVGLWHTQNGYWNGIDPNSVLGQTYSLHRYDDNKFFVDPDHSLKSFYHDFYGYFSKQGLSFVKVDNQISTTALANWSVSVSDLGKRLHTAMNEAQATHFPNGGLLNCMGMTSEAFFNFPLNGVARTSEDYFPRGTSYSLEGEGNSFSHVMQATYNALLFGQFSFPDFDMFETHNPNGEFHALARTANNGPIYVTDDADSVVPLILERITDRQGGILVSDTPLVPSLSSLFQLQDAHVFKMVSRVGNGGVILAANMIDHSTVSGSIVLRADFSSLLDSSGKFVVYEYFTQSLAVDVKGTDEIAISLDKGQYRFYTVVPFLNDYALLGLATKYNSLATIVSQEYQSPNILNVTLRDYGTFLMVSTRPVAKILDCDNSIVPFMARTLSSTNGMYRIVIDLHSSNFSIYFS